MGRQSVGTQSKTIDSFAALASGRKHQNRQLGIVDGGAGALRIRRGWQDHKDQQIEMLSNSARQATFAFALRFDLETLLAEEFPEHRAELRVVVHEPGVSHKKNLTALTPGWQRDPSKRHGLNHTRLTPVIVFILKFFEATQIIGQHVPVACRKAFVVSRLLNGIDDIVQDAIVPASMIQVGLHLRQFLLGFLQTLAFPAGSPTTPNVFQVSSYVRKDMPNARVPRDIVPHGRDTNPGQRQTMLAPP